MAAHGAPELSVTLPYYVCFKIRRKASKNKAPFIFYWRPQEHSFASAQVVLLHTTESGPQRVEVKPSDTATSLANSISVTGYNHSLWKLPADGEIEMREALSGIYQQLLKPGEKYELHWPGDEIDMWGWGSMKDYLGKKIWSSKARISDGPRLILPASKTIVEFAAVKLWIPWPDRPVTETELEYQIANYDELIWRLPKRPPRSPPPISPSE